ncbi:MAG: type I 3-dehydroquinate dehydratase [Acidobacteria bacterium RBG_16_68_9]|nr:MAG: type I 3-dehydroquinate dehydratase [Acidobacteria bacterium RBG_16_68_9]
MLRIGHLELGRIPRVAVALSDVELRHDAAAAKPLADLFELRIDRFQDHDPSYVTDVAAQGRAHGVPLLATVRAADQGGAAALSDRQRLDVLESVISKVDGVDIELHATVRDQVVALCRQHRKPVIISHHDFTLTPPDQALAALIDAGKDAGADIVKIATAAQGADDCDRLLGLLRTHRSKQLIVIAMGTPGAMSRVFFPLVGSLLTWGFLHAPSAPGQLPLGELVEELRRYSPEFARQREARESERRDA